MHVLNLSAPRSTQTPLAKAQILEGRTPTPTHHTAPSTLLYQSFGLATGCIVWMGCCLVLGSG
jgi:hypothetical protein